MLHSFIRYQFLVLVKEAKINCRLFLLMVLLGFTSILGLRFTSSFATFQVLFLLLLPHTFSVDSSFLNKANPADYRIFEILLTCQIDLKAFALAAFGFLSELEASPRVTHSTLSSWVVLSRVYVLQWEEKRSQMHNHSEKSKKEHPSSIGCMDTDYSNVRKCHCKSLDEHTVEKLGLKVIEG